MPETVGLLIIDAVIGSASVTGIGAAAFTVEIGALTISASTVATVVGSAAILGASIGLQYALANPNVPKPENGAQPLKQGVPSRQRGYWTCRLGGYYMLFIAAGGDSQDVIAFHSGPIEQALQLYLHDTPVTLATGSLADGAYATVNPPSGIYYQNVSVQVFYGTDTQSVYGTIINASTTSGVVTSAFAGKGTACIALGCGKATDPSQFTKIYPQGLPLPSVVAKCAPVWDPRDLTQSRLDRTTWKASPNPVLQLIDYLTEPDGGMGEDLNIILPPAALAQWMAEADLCDAIVGGRARYQSAGFYQFDNAPESVINKILACCDGWLVEAGDGSLVLTVGVYRAPTDPLTASHIVGFSVRKGQADEDTVNQLDISYTNPASGYVTEQVDSVRGDVAISLTGLVRAKQLDLSWVQNADQATALGERAMLRLNPEMSGTFVTTLYGMRYLGQRWIRVQFPAVKGLEDCIVEIQDQGELDLLAGRVTLTWNKVDPVALAAL